ARRLGREERHSDRRIRQADAGSGQEPGGCGDRSVAAAIAAYLDDVVRVYFGRRAPGVGEGRGRRDARRPGHRRLQRHARRDNLRHLPDAGVLRGHSLAGGAARADSGTWRTDAAIGKWAAATGATGSRGDGFHAGAWLSAPSKVRLRTNPTRKRGLSVRRAGPSLTRRVID